MPVPVESNSIRRMSVINVPSQDINFDLFDFQLCAPSTDTQSIFESQELEASFCRDFSCCGLVLGDLHDLLQHYEECHVRLEDDEGSLCDEDSSYWSPQLSFTSTTAPSSPLLDLDASADALKAKSASTSDFVNTGTLSPLTPLSPEPSTCMSPWEAEAPITVEKDTKGAKKRSHSPSSPLDLLSESSAKKLAVTGPGDLPTPIITDTDFLAQAGALLASTSINNNAAKPYKCNIPGCQKAYKNANGLKYHNQHGHCDLASDENENIASKPYQCTIGDCGKRYKNLNGLKYHIEHSHMAALNHNLANFGASIFSSFTLHATDEVSAGPSITIS